MKPTINYPDFEKLDLRVGCVVAANVPAWSNKLLELTVDFGAEIGQRTILTGIKEWYQPEDLQGKHFPFIVNLAERKMGEGVSQGMMMMADSDERPTIFELPSDILPGTVIR
jgi:methionyl-tRNA synthetase